MASSNSEPDNRGTGKQAAPAATPSKREQRRAAKAQAKAAKQAAKDQEKAAKKAAKAQKKGKGSQPANPASASYTPYPQTQYVDQGEAAGFVPAVAGSAYSQFTPSGIDPAKQAEVDTNRKRRRRRHVVVAVLVTLLCLVGVGTAGAYVYLQQLNANLAGEDEEEAQEVREALVPAPVGDEPFYMLLVGADDREGVEGARADTTILARIDPGNNQVTLLSIPRDTAIDIPGYGTQKFNAAYTFGGPSGTIDAASQLCGVEISHYAEVHFEALISIIDYIGGVDVDVPIPIDDVDAGGKLDAGYQHLNGEQAMIFARSRSYANGDFQRTTSQRLLIEAAVSKVMSMPPTELPGLLMKVTQSMTTDFSVQELLGLALAFQDEPPLVMYSALMPSYAEMWGDVSYVVADTYTFGEMMNVINAGGDPGTVVQDDYTVSTSKEAEEQGIELIVNLGDEAPDDGGYGAYDYYSSYYGDDYTYYEDYGVYGYTGGSDEEDEYAEDEAYDEESYDDSYYTDEAETYDDSGYYEDSEY